MNADHLIKRLTFIEPSSQVIWRLLHDKYGEDFFLECIEEEYGSTQKSADKFMRQIETQLSLLANEQSVALAELKSTYESQVTHLRLQLSRRSDDLAACQRSLQRAVELAKFDAKVKMDEVFREREQAIYQRNEADKQELYDEIRELKEECADS
jgi:cellulose biosynthesis protein BcsQ